MSRRHAIAVGVAVLAMAAALAQPLWIRTTGDEVTLAIEPVDPLSFFRGNYVDLTYDVPIDVPASLGPGDAAYVVFDGERPANALRVSDGRPDLGPGERCVRGEVRSSTRVVFPALEQYFVTAEVGGRLERDLESMVGVLRTTGSCRAVLVAIEPR
jgi:hypothetical protein